MPQVSILGPILFKVFINDLFLWLKKSDLHNFEDDNTIAVTCNNLTSLGQTLEKESESVTDWFKNNSMIADPGKVQAIILSKNATDVTHKLRIYDNEMKTTKSVMLLGVEIDYQIKFNEHIFTTVGKLSKCGVFSGPYFPVFGLNTEIFGVNLRIQSEYRKIWTRKNTTQLSSTPRTLQAVQ